MSRILAIDYGLKRVGLAVSDPLQLIAQALETVPASQVIKFLQDYLAREEVSCFVLGMPVNLDGTPTDATAAVRQFHQQLLKTFPQQPVHLMDERFTSKMALDAMIRGGMRKKDRRIKGNVDKISATIILQEFMEKKV